MPHYSYLRQLSVTGKPTYRRIQLYRTLSKAAANTGSAKDKKPQDHPREDEVELIYPQKYSVIGFGRK
ncbi:hypothetical protein L596_020561 [Steinernema carpocapsae]|uniref:Uncharacterized protein n=1 Tax=Steinernema carpocapsae TaxID=34508 RepID=A0A4U5MTW9_STECR|nr:hypothetical protein L596_020561 [Steinernema carpocapsae]